MRFITKPRVLLVEDEPLAAAAVEDLLIANCYEVVTAGDGEQALALFNADPCDVVITDLIMPRMDGLQLIASLRAVWPFLTIIVVSGSPDIAKIGDLTRNHPGLTLCLKKPLKGKDLIAALERMYQADPPSTF